MEHYNLYPHWNFIPDSRTLELIAHPTPTTEHYNLYPQNTRTYSPPPKHYNL